MTDAPSGRGRTVIEARAIERIARAVVADRFGVEPKAVSADLTDEADRLTLAVRTPIRVVPIARLQADPHAVDRSGGSILERAERGEAAIAEQIGALTGSAVSRVALRFTEAVIREQRRVR